MRYLFDNYCLDTQCYELHQAGVPIPLSPKVFQVLAYLLAQGDLVVSKEELLEHLWPGQYVGDGALNSYIMAVRKALGDRGDTPKLLRTVRGRGYRLVAPVEARDPVRSTVPLSPVPLPAAEDPARQCPPSSPLAGPSPEADPAGAIPPLAAGEYKSVSVLCCGLAEVPALVARRGPEGLYRLLQTVLGLAQEVVQRYAGSLTPYGSEGFIAVFGAPMAQEDHARRAVLAALELQQRLRQHPTWCAPPPEGELAVRMGLHSGLAVVGDLDPDPQRRATAVGEPLHLALRLQQQAAPRTILLSAATYHLVHTEVRAAPCGLLDIDSKSTPMPVYTVQEILRRQAGVVGRSPRVGSPFVGRERELALLHERLAAACAGRGQVVGLVGEPGMGKTRLLREFCQSLAGQSVTVYVGQCLSYGQASPYLPVRELLRQVCGIIEEDEDATHPAAVQHRLHACSLSAEGDVALLLQLLDLPVAPECLAQLSPQAPQARTFALLRHLILHTAQQQPLVLAVENLHWSDPASAAWLATLVERLADAAVLLVGTYRPGYQPPWGTHSTAMQVALAPLQAQESRAVVQAVLSAVPLPEARLRAIVARAGGNPFFLEELAWHTRDQGGTDTPGAVPETVSAVLAARIDRLPPEEKRLLQTAAVIGPAVPLPLLQAIAELPEAALHRGLAHLQAAEFLYETHLFPEPEYTFKHALTHEVAYGSLLLERRRVLHARLVEALEALAPERGAGQVERLAHHALRGEVWGKAVPYCQQAGARAEVRAAIREAVAYFEQALQVLAHLPEDGDTRVLAIELRLALGLQLTQLGENRRHLTLLGEAEALARALDDGVRLGRVLTRMAFVLNVTGDLNDAMATGEQALALAAALGDSALQMEASARIGQLYLNIGDFGRAVELLRWNVEAADREFSTSSTTWRIMSRAYLAWTLSELGAFTEGQRYGQEALRLATLEGRGTTPLVAHGFLGHLYLAQGDLEHAIRVLDQGLALCRASGNQTTLRITAADLGFAYVLQGRLAEGRALIEEAISVAIRTGAMGRHSGWVTWLSEVCRLEERGEEAWQHAHQALDLARQHKERANEARALHQLGVVQAHADPPDAAQAEAHYQQALALAEELGMRPLVAHCHLGLGRLYGQTGRGAQARTALVAAIDLYRAMDMTFWLPQAEAALAQVA